MNKNGRPLIRDKPKTGKRSLRLSPEVDAYLDTFGRDWAEHLEVKIRTFKEFKLWENGSGKLSENPAQST